MMGTLEVITGCMFSGKSTEMIRRLRREINAPCRKVVAFKPAIDDRYHMSELTSHSGIGFGATVVRSAVEIPNLVGDASVIGIDEAQFLDEAIVGVCNLLVAQGRRVIVAGLDTDYRGVPFGSMPTLMAIADQVQKVNAVCVVCGADASRTQRIVASEDQIVVGGSSAYEARCRDHWKPEPVFYHTGAVRDDG